MNYLPPKEYYKSLPKKHAGSGILLFNSNSELLIVKPNYKDGWILPGGTNDAEETPRHCVLRETKEETGTDLEKCDFICVDYKHTKDGQPENFQFLFYGGMLTNNQIENIIFPKDEIEEIRFVSIKEALRLLRPNLAKRLPHCLEAIRTGRPVYLENEDILN